MLVLMLMSMLTSHASVDFFAFFVLPCAMVMSPVKTRLNLMIGKNTWSYANWKLIIAPYNSHMSTRPCVFADNHFEAFRAVKL